MSIRTLFNIVLKILGILFIKEILLAIPQLLTIFVFAEKPELSGGIFTFISSLILLGIYALLSYYFIFRSNFIIDKLKLTDGFDQEIIPLNIHRSTVLSISIIILGGIIVADEIPNFCRQIFYFFQEKQMTHGATNPSIAYSLTTAAKIIIGFLLLGNQRQIVNFIERKRKD